MQNDHEDIPYFLTIQRDWRTTFQAFFKAADLCFQVAVSAVDHMADSCVTGAA